MGRTAIVMWKTRGNKEESPALREWKRDASRCAQGSVEKPRRKRAKKRESRHQLIAVLIT
jgi:hypothetical protein